MRKNNRESVSCAQVLLPRTWILRRSRITLQTSGTYLFKSHYLTAARPSQPAPGLLQTISKGVFRVWLTEQVPTGPPSKAVFKYEMCVTAVMNPDFPSSLHSEMHSWTVGNKGCKTKSVAEWLVDTDHPNLSMTSCRKREIYASSSVHFPFKVSERHSWLLTLSLCDCVVRLL
ncbi:hypothetical protein NQZ68_002431 [Dissostichus eleginoides]|nr:hypothetical protein NQZ68_002431 [Dissostichus eleginoides]